MKKSSIVTIVAAGLAAATIGLATPAEAAPTGSGSAQDTISQLQANGYRVILTRLSDVPLDQAKVVSVRPGRQITRPVTDSGGDLRNEVLYTTVYVDVK